MIRWDVSGIATGWRRAALAAVVAAGFGACDTTEQTVALGAAALTAVGASIPSHEIEQTYYLGVFDRWISSRRRSIG